MLTREILRLIGRHFGDYLSQIGIDELGEQRRKSRPSLQGSGKAIFAILDLMVDHSNGARGTNNLHQDVARSQLYISHQPSM